MMTRVLYIFLSALFLSLGIWYPPQAYQAASADVWTATHRVDREKPSVYLEYSGEGRTFENCTLQEQDSYRLRLVNNTTVPINVPAGYPSTARLDTIKVNDAVIRRSLPRGATVNLCYEVEKIVQLDQRSASVPRVPVEPLPDLDYLCRCDYEVAANRQGDYDGLWIAPGSNVIFDVPRRFLAKNLKIYTLFNYPWEFEGTKLTFNEPHHQTYFYGSSIPR